MMKIHGDPMTDDEMRQYVTAITGSNWRLYGTVALCIIAALLVVLTIAPMVDRTVDRMVYDMIPVSMRGPHVAPPIRTIEQAVADSEEKLEQVRRDLEVVKALLAAEHAVKEEAK